MTSEARAQNLAQRVPCSGGKTFRHPQFLPTHPPRVGVVALRPSPNPSPPSSALSIGDDVAVVLSSGRRVAVGGAERQSNDFFSFREAPRDGCPRSSNIFTGIILRASDGWAKGGLDGSRRLHRREDVNICLPCLSNTTQVHPIQCKCNPSYIILLFVIYSLTGVCDII